MSRSIMTGALALVVTCLVGSASAQANGDLTVWDIGIDGGNTNDIHYWGQSGGIAGYNFATQSCNEGNAQLDWFDSFGDTRHPVISQNMFRLANGRFEQIGQSWLKHGFCAVNEFEAGCGPCQSTNCDTLGIGCADTYWATLNDGAGGRSKSFVNATTGVHVESGTPPSGPTAIRGRLQVRVAEIDPNLNSGAEYFIEGQYVAADDAQAGLARNNNSWRRLNVISVSNVDGGGTTQRHNPAIYAWQDSDPEVQVHEITNTEGGITTYFFVASKVSLVGADTWAYEYAIQNTTSDQCANSFRVPHDPATTISNVGFRGGSPHHSGDPYDQTDWTQTVTLDSTLWETDSFATNANANAIRWGTLYNFRFEANAPPTTGIAQIGLFKPGTNSALAVPDLQVPGEPNAQCGAAASVVNRNDGSNPQIYTAIPPSPGGTASFGLFALYNFGVVIGYSAPGNTLLANGQALLVDTNSNPQFSVALTGLPLGQASVAVPNDVAFCGVSSYTQAVLVGPAGGGPSFQLTNAQDLTVGF